MWVQLENKNTVYISASLAEKVHMPLNRAQLLIDNITSVET